MRISPLRMVLPALVMGGLAAGCAKPAPRATPVPPPALELPVPPPRILAPVAEPEPPPPGPSAPAEAAPPARPRSGGRPGATSAEGRSEGAKPSGPPEQPAAGPVEAPRASDPSAPALRTQQTANPAEADRRVRDVLARAQKELDRVNSASLSTDAKAQYETARRFIGQANDALTARNYMFAAYLADKAETLARGLAGR